MSDVLLAKAGIIERCMRRIDEEYADDPRPHSAPPAPKAACAAATRATGRRRGEQLT